MQSRISCDTQTRTRTTSVVPCCTCLLNQTRKRFRNRSRESCWNDCSSIVPIPGVCWSRFWTYFGILLSSSGPMTSLDVHPKSKSKHISFYFTENVFLNHLPFYPFFHAISTSDYRLFESVAKSFQTPAGGRNPGSGPEVNASINQSS